MSFELNRRLVAKRPPLDTPGTIDAVTASIINGAFETICFEAATHLGRAASSAIINQSNERNASLIDANGRLAAVSVGIPQLLFVSPLAVRWGLENFDSDDWGPGDVFVGNDPDYGGGHLPDYTVYAPLFDDAGKLVLIQALQAHQGDTGGKDPGGFSVDATDIFGEGLGIPVLKLVHRTKPRRDAIDLLIRNNRFPSFAGDIAAMISAVQAGVRSLQTLLTRYGVDAVKAAVNFNIDQTETRFRQAVAEWPDGEYPAHVWIDQDTAGNPDVHVQVNCRITGDQLVVDMTGSDARPELVNVWNTYANTRGYAIAQLASMVDPDINKNEGLFYAVEMVIPEGSILQPPPNKPAALGSFHPAVEVGEAICIALSPILPQRSAPQVYKLGMPSAVIGFSEAGEMWMDQGVDVRASDASATQGLDGWGAMCAGLGNLILATAEDAESRFPVLNLSREMTIDSGGAGRWRGQPGTCNIKQVLEPVSAMTWMVSRKHPLRGLNGGDDAPPYCNIFLFGSEDEFEVENAIAAQLPAGAITSYQYGGGAGFEDPLLRDPVAVREDVLDEYVSIEAARERYGVVLNGSVENWDIEIDVGKTEHLRGERMSAKTAGSTR
jgi:N-methylhydantoinase B